MTVLSAVGNIRGCRFVPTGEQTHEAFRPIHFMMRWHGLAVCRSAEPRGLDKELRNMKTLAIFAVVLPVGVLGLGCGGEKPPEAHSPPMAMGGGRATARETPAQAAMSGTVFVSNDILRACGLSEADAYFAFDSSKLEKQDIDPLNKIATCFETGALKGRSMKLIGHADPRGSADYNLTLGQARADTVEDYLVKKGLSKGTVMSSSRGALDATGTDEAGWIHDRRVDVDLGS
jgi:peptidoglycan-associated lipoprotein